MRKTVTVHNKDMIWGLLLPTPNTWDKRLSCCCCCIWGLLHLTVGFWTACTRHNSVCHYYGKNETSSNEIY